MGHVSPKYQSKVSPHWPAIWSKCERSDTPRVFCFETPAVWLCYLCWKLTRKGVLNSNLFPTDKLNWILQGKTLNPSIGQLCFLSLQTVGWDREIEQTAWAENSVTLKQHGVKRGGEVSCCRNRHGAKKIKWQCYF